MIVSAHNSATASPEPDHDRLFGVAESQAGYFTTVQAGAAGFTPSLLSCHVKRGQFERARPGVYRPKRFPASPYEDLFVAWLWAGTEAVISHDSALALYDLSDQLPAETHVTVPRTTSRHRAGLRLHTSGMPRGDVMRCAGLPVTTPARTIVDVASAGLADELVLHLPLCRVTRSISR